MSAEADRPRVLILSPSAFNGVSGGGITLTNLFRGWPRERLAVVHADVIPPDPGPCARYFALGPEELGWEGPLRRLGGFRGAEPGAATPPAQPGVLGRWARAVAALLLAEGGLRDRATLSPALRSFCDGFRPELIYTLLGSLGFVRLAGALASRAGVPVAVHMMDDWPRTRYRGAALSPLLAGRSDRALRALLRTAALRLAISEPMARAFGERYGLPFDSAHNPVELERWTSAARRDWTPQRPLRLLYSGAVLASAQLDSLCDVARSADALARAGEATELRIHTASALTPAQRARLLAGPAVGLEPVPDDESLPRLLSEAGALVLPVNFDRHSADYVRYSFPTKIPAYLASGTPILAYGPAAVTQIQLARDQGWGLVVDRRDPAALDGALRRLAGDAALRAALGERARAVAESEHAADRVRPRFQAALVRAAREPAR